jgi:hypothetical protein
MYYNHNTKVIIITKREKEKNVKMFLKKNHARLQFRSKKLRATTTATTITTTTTTCHTRNCVYP